MQPLASDLSPDISVSGDPFAVLVRWLRKTYSEVEAVAGIDLRIGRGEIFAFLGPNGAGKTTAVEILEGFRQRTEGEVAVLGCDPEHATRAWRDRLGIVLQESAPDPDLTVNESLGALRRLLRPAEGRRCRTRPRRPGGSEGRDRDQALRWPAPQA